MNNFFYFVLGVLVGWLIEWVIDFFYWRKQCAEQNALQSQALPSKNGSVNQLVEKSTTVTTPDDLKIIKGIGAVIEGKLNAAGIYTFEQLGNLTANELRQILGNVIERLADEDSLLKQARDLAHGKK